jgi:general stress protein 26
MESIPDDVRDEIWDFFSEYQGIYLATAEDKRPYVRPVTLAYMDSRFWVFTGTDDAKVRQIRSNPRIEFCLNLKKGDHSGYVRASGKADIVLDKETRMKYTLLEIKIEEVEYLKPGELTAPRYKV